MKCKGFLFDLDGTLVDSLPAVEHAWTNWANSRGLAPEEVLGFIHGKQAITSIRHFMPGESEEAIQAQFRLIEKIESEDINGITALPGAVELLERLNKLSMPWAIVTSGSVPVARARHAAGELATPEIFITAELVARGKPNPDPYLLGAQRLGLKPEECVVVEDAPAGVLSGLAAGCKVIAVNAPDDTPKLEQVDLVLKSLAVLQVEPVQGGEFLISVIDA